MKNWANISDTEVLPSSIYEISKIIFYLFGQFHEEKLIFSWKKTEIKFMDPFASNRTN